MADVRDGLAECWPTRPSLRVLPPAERVLFEFGLRLVAGGPWDWGELYLAVEAGLTTLDAHGHALAREDALRRWSLGRVDPAVQPIPASRPAAALRAAIPVAEAARDRLHRKLDEIPRIAPPEAWLPTWTVEDARTYIGVAKWRHARPNQPPHEYTIRDWRPDLRHDFLAFAQLIQSRGPIPALSAISDSLSPLRSCAAAPSQRRKRTPASCAVSARGRCFSGERLNAPADPNPGLLPWRGQRQTPAVVAVCGIARGPSVYTALPAES
jgi:hypothetical protein